MKSSIDSDGGGASALFEASPADITTAVAQSVDLSVHPDGPVWVATTVDEWAARSADDVEPHLAAALAGRR